MARSGFSSRFLRACYMAQTEEILTTLVEIRHPNLAVPLRYHNKMKPLVSNGNTYESRMFTMGLPNDITDTMPQVSLTLDNTDNLISYATYLLDTTFPYDVYMSIIKKTDPNTIEYGPNHLVAMQLAVDDVTAVFSCTLEQGLEAMWPMHAFTPYSHPAIFGSIG